MEYTDRLIHTFYGGVGEYLDAAVVYDDLGHQTGPLLSLADYRDFYKPYQAETIRRIRRHLRPDAKIILKSGGSIAQFVPDLIEIGVDVLSPVQPLARDMEPWKLKQEYGKDISFLGGFDVQSLLPFGDTDEIRRGVQLLLGEYARGGGYAFSAGYVIQCNTPPENIVTLFDAAYNYGIYPLDDGLETVTYVDYLRSLGT
jgi:uroporphyrinogen decarboxylase